MHVEHLLGDESLGLRLLWAEGALLRREINGVTVTDLEDPARFVRPGEAVLSGLVWWTPEAGRDKAERFVSALRDADAAVLLAGEETHGSVPDELIEACSRHSIPVAGVPAHVMFRAVTETVYLQQWGELSRHHALPEYVRGRLSRLVARDAGPREIVATAFAHLADGAAARVLTAAGRTVAATAGADVLPAPEAARILADSGGVTVPVDADAVSPYERWYLHLPDPAAAPPRLLHEVAALLGRSQAAQAQLRTSARRAAGELGALLAVDGADSVGAEGALRACGLSAGGPYRVLAAATGARGEGLAESALAEVLAGVGAESAAVGRLPDGTAFAVVPEATTGTVTTTGLGEVWPRVAACERTVPLHGGTGSPARGLKDLPRALAEARYALASARSTAPDASLLTDATTLTSLEALLTGVPAPVRAAYTRSVLGPLLDIRSASATPLLETLTTFLACDGSWARTAEALHLHVNTVHYRVGRIERLTGRDLSRLTDRLDLWAALLCRSDLDVTGDRHGHSSTSRAR
ncbi:PucR family transcriptional regulator [Streptomyces sp. CMSTAAHL-2]|uniref:PucR family transcriptional regulator n=1 Tax=Streptomyces sp. CMSTAAHL-2 TaxID=2904522 RepID=UPI001E3C9116|nr:PucR family transcriptional regulator [Streptomyces sp. CMSTAAHL-2]MCE3030130.1 PucR family transcriptional regulator [Streptomyces sp. CMSTAAHL-2]